MPRDHRTKVLFVCLGNSCRSPMAEAIARRDAVDVIDGSSAGLIPLGFVARMAKQTLEANGYSADGLESKPVKREALEAADVVINMSGRTRELVFEGVSRVEDWDVEDPYGADPALYQRICEELQRRVANLAEKLRESEHTASVPSRDSRRGSGK